jgi:hypothetical protein
MSPPRAPLPSLLFVLLLAAGAAFGQGTPPTPPNLEPVPDIPPPPEIAADAELEPQVTIIRREGELVEEVRIAGELKFIRVTPRHGRPYYLIPDANGQNFVRRDSLDPGLKVPLWVLFSW